jgi:hypothetical protein
MKTENKPYIIKIPIKQESYYRKLRLITNEEHKKMKRKEYYQNRKRKLRQLKEK